jgi:hypothetical protein
MAMQFLFRGVTTVLGGQQVLDGNQTLGSQPAVVFEEQTLGRSDPAEIVLATPVASFHNATLQVYAQVLRDMGHKVRTVTDIQHKFMYPYFTGAEGKDRYIDMVVSSDLPNNHAPWLEAYKESYSVVGTCYEMLSIFLAAPGYAGVKKLSDLKGSKVNKTIIGFDVDPCARCPDLAATWIKEELGEGWTYQPTKNAADLVDIYKKKLENKELFVTTWWSPTYWNAVFPELQQLDMERFAPALFNQGKALVSTASPLITDPKNAATLRALSSVFIGNSELSKMDHEIFQRQQKGGADAGNAPYIVAQKWIKDNARTYSMFFW